MIEKKYALEKTIHTDAEIMLYDLVDLGKAGVIAKPLGDKITIQVQGEIVFDLTDGRDQKIVFRMNPM